MEVSLKGKIRAVERKISTISCAIEIEKKLLNEMQRDVNVVQSPINNLSREALASVILSGLDLYVGKYGNICFYEQIEETEYDFNKRVEHKKAEILRMEAMKEELSDTLVELNRLKQEEYAKYKDPEYIQYLRLKNKFAND